MQSEHGLWNRLPHDLLRALVREYASKWSMVLWYAFKGMQRLDVIDEEMWLTSKRVLCKEACALGALALIQWSIEHECTVDPDCVRVAADGGDLRTLQWLRSRNPSLPWTCKAYRKACEKGDVRTVRWLHERGCPHDLDVTPRAAKGGHLDLVAWWYSIDPSLRLVPRWWGLAAHGDLSLLARALPPTAEAFPQACVVAARRGNLDVLKWLRAQEPPFFWCSSVLAAAAKRGDIKMMEWICASPSGGDPCPRGVDACIEAAGAGHLSALQWLRSLNPPCPWDEDAARAAAKNGHLDVLCWILNQVSIRVGDQGQAMSTTTTEPQKTIGFRFGLMMRNVVWLCQLLYGAALQGQQMHVLEWLLCKYGDAAWREGGNFEKTTLYVRAFEGGSLAVIQWLSDSSVPLPSCGIEWLSQTVGRSGDKSIAQWCFTRGWLDLNVCFDMAMRKGHLLLLRCLLSMGYEIPIACKKKPKHCKRAAEKGLLDLFRWLLAQGFPCTIKAYQAAQTTQQYHVLRWMQIHGIPRQESMMPC